MIYTYNKRTSTKKMLIDQLKTVELHKNIESKEIRVSIYINKKKQATNCVESIEAQF